MPAVDGTSPERREDRAMPPGRHVFLYGPPTVELFEVLREFALEPASPEFEAPLKRVLPLARAGRSLRALDRGDNRRHAVLVRWAYRLVARNRLIMAIVLGVLAAVLVVKGMAAL